MENFRNPVVNFDNLPEIKCSLKKYVTVRENGYLIHKVVNWKKK